MGKYKRKKSIEPVINTYIHNPNQPQRGEIYYVNLPKGIDSEQSGRRPVIILSNNIGNKFSTIVSVAIITSVDKGSHIPTTVKIKRNYGLTEDSVIHCEQIMTLSKSRLDKYVGFISDITIQEKINNAIKISLGV